MVGLLRSPQLATHFTQRAPLTLKNLRFYQLLDKSSCTKPLLLHPCFPALIRSPTHRRADFRGQVNFFPGNLSIVKLTKFVTVKVIECMLRFWFRVNSKAYAPPEFGMVIAA